MLQRNYRSLCTTQMQSHWGKSITIYVQRVIERHNDCIKTEKIVSTGIGQKITGKPTNFIGINVFSCARKQLSLIFHEKLKALPQIINLFGTQIVPS